MASTLTSASLPSLRVVRGVTRGAAFTFTFDGGAIEAFPGETVAAAVLAAGIRILRRTEKEGRPRGLFCGMGVCFDCLVTVDGRPHLRACLVRVEAGMCVQTQDEAEWRIGRK